LVTAHYDRVYALCRRMLGNEADALDATQDALLAAIRGLGRFDARSSVATWLYRIATNACIDEMRRRRRRPLTGIAADVAEVAGEVSFDAPGLFVVPTGSGLRRFEEPEGSAADSSDVWLGGARGSISRDGNAAWGRDPADVVVARLDVDVALASLPDEFRTAVVLRDVCDLPYDEIADILQVPVGTVRSRIARARSALAAWGAERESRPGHHSGGEVVAGNRSGSPHVEADEIGCAPAPAQPATSTARHEHRRQRGPTTEQSQKEEHTQ
jgi:RNA polymerase sigma-70 factor (ECF subfamily)